MPEKSEPKLQPRAEEENLYNLNKLVEITSLHFEAYTSFLREYKNGW